MSHEKLYNLQRTIFKDEIKKRTNSSYTKKIHNFVRSEIDHSKICPI